MLYSIKIGLFKKIKNVKGHIILKENSDIMMIILKDEQRVFLNLRKIRTIKFSKGWFEIEKNKIKKDIK